MPSKAKAAYKAPGEIPPLPIRKFTVDEYHLMAKAGVFVDGDPFELLEGWIVPKMTRNVPHDMAIELVDNTLRASLPKDWRVRVQCAITTIDSEPEPDIAVVRGPIRRIQDRHPGPGEIGMLVEVADASLEHDRTIKGRLFARAGISIYWIVNLNDRQIEVYTDPTGPIQLPCYHNRHDFGVENKVPLILKGRTVCRFAVRDLLP